MSRSVVPSSTNLPEAGQNTNQDCTDYEQRKTRWFVCADHVGFTEGYRSRLDDYSDA